MADALRGAGGVASRPPIVLEDVVQSPEAPKNQEFVHMGIPVKLAPDSAGVARAEDFVGNGEKVENAVDALNKLLEVHNSEVRLSVFKDPDTIVIKLIEKDTEKVIREFPSEKILNMVHNFLNMMGLIVDKKV